MLKTCEICHRRDYCDHCALQDSCYWIKVVPSQGGRRLSCESFECAHYDEYRKIKAKNRIVR